jgi:peptidase C25-like protein
MINDDRLYLNGIDGETGQYLVEPMELADAASMAKGIKGDNAVFSWLRRVWETISQPHLGLPFDLDPTKIEEVGWAVVFHQNESQAVRDALQPLIERRKQQVGDERKVKVLAYRDGQKRAEWLAGYGVGAGNVEPTKVPFYLLFVGSPKQIPYGFCQEIGVEYGVGRLHFDGVEEYSRYVESVIAYETSEAVPNAKEAVFFGVRHEFDKATRMSADLLVNPLADGPDETTPGVATRWGFATRKLWGASATKSALTEALRANNSAKPPAFLFTASHGMGFKKGHERQLSEQGALLCQDWPGFGQISPDHYFAAADLPTDANLRGLITFQFACFGAGTPEFDNYAHKPNQPAPQIALQPFFAALPKAMLAHPKGGALACIGHVERAWGYSIIAPNAGPQLIPFQNAIGRLLVGQPVGYATKDFNEKFAALSASLGNLLEQVGFGARVSDLELANTWVERNDAGGYIIIGDPAVRLRVEQLK